jgi:hypothetical protein
MTMTNDRLVGYVRRANKGGELKISINVDAFKDSDIYVTSDGQTYVSLSTNISAIEKIIRGERVVTTVTQTRDN